MIELLIIPYMALMARLSGGGYFADKIPKPLPEILFGAGFGFFYWQIFDNTTAAALALVWSFAWMETGHGSVLKWEGRGNRRQFLTPIVDFIYSALPAALKGGKNYCRLFMAVKGFLIGLPVGGVLLAILWPLAYEIGHRLRRHEVSELLSGVFAGASILVFYFVLK